MQASSERYRHILKKNGHIWTFAQSVDKAHSVTAADNGKGLQLFCES